MTVIKNIKQSPYFFAFTLVALASLLALTFSYQIDGISGQEVKTGERFLYEASLGAQAIDYCNNPNAIVIDKAYRNKFMGLECTPTSNRAKYCCAKVPEQ